MPAGKETQAPYYYAERIVRDPRICGGQAVVRGTRVMLRTLLASLADGDPLEEILGAFPSLTPEDMRAVIALAAASALRDLPVPSFPQIRRRPEQRRRD